MRDSLGRKILEMHGWDGVVMIRGCFVMIILPPLLAFVV